jgi:hypothetical protein
MKDKGKRITVRLEKHVIVLVTREVKRGLAVNKAQKAEVFSVSRFYLRHDKFCNKQVT